MAAPRQHAALRDLYDEPLPLERSLVVDGIVLKDRIGQHSHYRFIDVLHSRGLSPGMRAGCGDKVYVGDCVQLSDGRIARIAEIAARTSLQHGLRRTHACVCVRVFICR